MQRCECRIGRIKMDITTHRILARMAQATTKLYNTALWHSRKQWDETGKIPSGYDLQKVVLASVHHDLLPAHTYQHTAHQVGNAYKSWYKLRKKDKTARPPGFRPKESSYPSGCKWTLRAAWSRRSISTSISRRAFLKSTRRQ